MNDAVTNSFRHWRQETDSDGIVWLCIDKADTGANVLSGEVMLELADILTPLEQDPPRGLVIWSAKKSGFVMGADINEFTTLTTSEQAYELVRLGQQLFDRIEALRCPTTPGTSTFAHAMPQVTPARRSTSRWSSICAATPTRTVSARSPTPPAPTCK